MSKIYFATLPSDPNTFIGITHGEQGYNTTTVYDQSHADTLNERQGITPAMVDAAVSCSMFNCWANFEKLTETEGRLAKA
jgi:hypothetical protein